MYYIIFSLISLLVGVLIGRFIRKPAKPIGTLVLNESDKTKEYFEFHFEEDIDSFKDKGLISFKLIKQ